MENIIGFDALYQSMEKCKNNVMWKDSVAHFVLNGVEEITKLEEQVKNGTYRVRKTKTFMLTSPKRREAMGVAFRDRVLQRSLNDNAIYPSLSKHFIYDNCACQKGKGTDFARKRLHTFLHKFYLKHKIGGYVLQCDISGYYPNMQHFVVEKTFKKYLDPDVYDLAVKILRQQYEGDVGYFPGSQMIQLAGISVLNEMDHFIKEKLHIKFYLRYMDDFILIHKDKAYLEECKKQIQTYLESIKFQLHPKKTKIYPLSQGIKFLGFYHRLTDTGKILMQIDPKNVKMERRKLRRLVAKAKKGGIEKDKVDACYDSWKAHAIKGNSHNLIRRMDKYYQDLWA